METHAHDLHKAPGHGWKHYFFEFFMLFLAVTLGFFVENKREHFVEHKREKEYISSLTRDLEKDTAILHYCIKGNTFKRNTYDSLFTLLNRPNPFLHIDSLYYYFIPTNSYLSFHAAQGTIRQLENAGGLRLIRDNQAVDSITWYYDLVRLTDGQAATFYRYFDQYHEVAFNFFDYSQIDTLFYQREKILLHQRKYSLLTQDPHQAKLLFNKLYVLWIIEKSYIGDLKELEQMATSTLAYLKKEYHLE